MCVLRAPQVVDHNLSQSMRNNVTKKSVKKRLFQLDILQAVGQNKGCGFVRFSLVFEGNETPL